jgi:16S rRNA C967 or C1407 C5-methylase (RsmB/RsmF family)
MEAYYAAQGLHDLQFVSGGGESSSRRGRADDGRGGNNDAGIITHNDDKQPPATESQLRPCSSFEEREAERRRWRQTIATVLPASFRIGRDIPREVRRKLERELFEMMVMVRGDYSVRSTNNSKCDSNANVLNKEETADADADADGNNCVTASQGATNNDEVTVPSDPLRGIVRIPFISGAYQLPLLDRAAIRRRPEHARLHSWLKQHTLSGSITRQETVSMIPPILLRPDPNHLVLDMCAAPGSKTSQLLEASSWSSSSSFEEEIGGGGSGCVVANDASLKRAHMLTTQLRRVLHLNPRAVVTCCPAQFFPSVAQFDAVLADVPCTGDGTLRKNIDVWTSWSQLGALALHALQIDIASKGFSLLKVGGRMCYSTCSLNPVEDEAVVAELLRKSQGSLELVDVRPLLQEFRTRPGMSSWKVLCEVSTQRAARNHQKKNSEKMQQRRREWEKKNAGTGSGYGAAGATAPQSAEEDEHDTPQVVPAGVVPREEAVAEATRDDNEQDPDLDGSILVAAIQGGDAPDINFDGFTNKAATEAAASSISSSAAAGVVFRHSDVRRFEPDTYDPDELLKMAESAGLRHYASFESVPELLRRRIRASAFPPTPEEVEEFHLERCIRCLPHDNDTGGFFVAILQKTGPTSKVDERRNQLREDDERDPNQVVPPPVAGGANNGGGDGSRDAKRAKLFPDSGLFQVKDGDRPRDHHAGTDELNPAIVAGNSGSGVGADASSSLRSSGDKRYLMRDSDGNRIPDLGRDDFVPVRDETIDSLSDFYGLQSTLPRALLMTRAGGEAKVISYVAPSVKTLLLDAGLQSRITIVTTGLKVLIRKGQDCEVPYRLSQEGLHLLAPHMNRRKFTVCRNDFEALLSPDVVPFSRLSPELQSSLALVSVGSIVIVLDRNGAGQGGDEVYPLQNCKMMLAKWRCRADKVDNLVPKVDLEAIRDKLHALEHSTNATARIAARPPQLEEREG